MSDSEARGTLGVRGWPGRADDWLNGYALRQLREALPDEPRVTVTWWQQGIEKAVMVEVDRGRQAVASGATIAEAADKCREALG